MPDVYIGLGSNIGDAAANLREAVTRLARTMAIEKISSAYWTEPVGLREQPFFLNAVLRASTDMAAHEVLRSLRAIEEQMGRRREVPMGPRLIDLDLLVYDDLRIEEAGLVLPHPRMEERRFVLAPLAEIEPGLTLRPGGATVSRLLAELPAAESVERMELAGWPPEVHG